MVTSNHQTTMAKPGRYRLPPEATAPNHRAHGLNGSMGFVDEGRLRENLFIRGRHILLLSTLRQECEDAARQDTDNRT